MKPPTTEPPANTANQPGQPGPESLLTRLGLRHWAPFNLAAVTRAHDVHLAFQMTPSDAVLDGLTLHCPAGVYHPTSASSSAFMLRHLANLPTDRPLSVLELGVGSGALLLSLARRLGAGRYLGVDVSPTAINAARSNADRNGLEVEIRHSDLFATLAGERFDVILFNPPLYDREPRNEVENQLLCDPGGRLLQRFVDALPQHLQPGGAAYLVVANIGVLTPLDDPALRLSLQGAELFESGMVRAVLKVERGG